MLQVSRRAGRAAASRGAAAPPLRRRAGRRGATGRSATLSVLCEEWFRASRAERAAGGSAARRRVSESRGRPQRHPPRRAPRLRRALRAPRSPLLHRGGRSRLRELLGVPESSPPSPGPLPSEPSRRPWAIGRPDAPRSGSQRCRGRASRPSADGHLSGGAAAPGLRCVPRTSERQGSHRAPHTAGRSSDPPRRDSRRAPAFRAPTRSAPNDHLAALRRGNGNRTTVREETGSGRRASLGRAVRGARPSVREGPIARVPGALLARSPSADGTAPIAASHCERWALPAGRRLSGPRYARPGRTVRPCGAPLPAQLRPRLGG